MDKCDNLISYYIIKKIFYFALLNKIESSELLKNNQWLEKSLNHNYWCSTNEFKDLVIFISRKLNINIFDLGYQINLTNHYDSFVVGLIKILPLRILKTIIKKHVKDSINKNLIVDINFIENYLLIDYYVIHRKCYCKEICDYNNGAIKAILYVKGFQNVIFKETHCILNGDLKCSSIYTWSKIINKPYYKIFPSIINVFIHNNSSIDEYIWNIIKIKPEHPDDINKNIFKESI